MPAGLAVHYKADTIHLKGYTLFIKLSFHVILLLKHVLENYQQSFSAINNKIPIKQVENTLAGIFKKSAD